MWLLQSCNVGASTHRKPLPMSVERRCIELSGAVSCSTYTVRVCHVSKPFGHPKHVQRALKFVRPQPLLDLGLCDWVLTQSPTHGALGLPVGFVLSVQVSMLCCSNFVSHLARAKDL